MLASRSRKRRSSGRRSATDAIVSGSDRMAFGVVGTQEAIWRRPLDQLGQLRSQIHRILHTGLEALSTVRGMPMCGVAGQKDPSVAAGRGVPRGPATSIPGLTPVLIVLRGP